MNKLIETLGVVLLASFPASFASAQNSSGIAGSAAMYQEHCAQCHGENLEGTPIGRPLMGELRHGDTVTAIGTSIRNGYEATGMPPWQRILSDTQIQALALYVTETRANVDYETFHYDAPINMPEGPVSTELHAFRIETVAENLDAAPYSIAPLRDGRILLVEKKRGISIIGNDGKQSELISGTPQAYADSFIVSMEQERGWGWLFDIVPHPDYAQNQWIYLAFSDRCEGCNAISRAAASPVSMLKVVRGKIRGNAWVEQQTIWEADLEHYGNQTDLAAGGRLAFDNAGHLYFSVGVMGVDIAYGIQDPAFPWGKIHRIHADGSIPADNPFADQQGVYRSVYTIGHRSPSGLEFDPYGGGIWGTEHGPRGGDELNLLLPGANYGWPLTSLGLNYNGTPVDYGKELGIAFELSDIQQPVVDMTPSPAVSSFIISRSEQFPAWRGDFLVGSLKARSLYRFRMQNNQLVTRETLLEGFARIRDIEQGYNGEIYLLLEHNAGSRVVRLVPGVTAGLR